MLDAHDPFARYRECQALLSGLDPGHQMSAVDLMIELPDVFLEKVDRRRWPPASRCECHFSTTISWTTWRRCRVT